MQALAIIQLECLLSYAQDKYLSFFKQNESPEYLIGHAQGIISRVGGLVTEGLELVERASRLSIDPSRTLSIRSGIRRHDIRSTFREPFR